MASFNFSLDAPDKIHKWIERKPLTEAVSWTSREKFYLIASVIQFGTDWKSIAQTVKNAGEPYRPIEWYTATNCERQFRVVLSNQTNEVKSMDYSDMLKYVYDALVEDFIRDLKRTQDNYLAKYSSLHGAVCRIKQGNLSRNEINSLFSQAKRNDVESRQYMEQLKTRQNATLASENSSSGSSEEPIKWNAPSAPLLTSLLRSRNTIPNHRNSTAISSQLLSSSTPRTRSGKSPLSPTSVRNTQGTPTLSKLLEAPANPYIPSPPKSVQKNNPNEVIGTDQLNGNNCLKENSQSPILNRVRVDNFHGPFNQLNKCELSYSKRQTSRSPVSAAKNGTKTSSSVVSLLSDSENEDGDMSTMQNICSKNLFQFGEKNNIFGSPIITESRATRSTLSKESFKLVNDNELAGENNEHEALQQQSEDCQMTESNLVDDEIIDIDQIEVEPLPIIHNSPINSRNVLRSSSTQKIDGKTSAESSLINNTNSKDINNQMLEEISTNFALNSSVKNDIIDCKNVIVEHSQIDNTNINKSLVPVISSSAVQDTIMLRKDGQYFPSPKNILTSFDGKLLKQNRIIELKSANIRCIDSRNDKTILFTSQPIVVVNKIKKSFNIKLPPGIEDKTKNVQVVNYDPQKTVKVQGNKHDLVQLLDRQCSYSDEVIIIDDDVNINVDGKDESSKKSESQIMSLKAVVDNDNSMPKNSKNISLHVNKKTNNDKTIWNVFGKPQNLVDTSTKKIVNQDALCRSEREKNLLEINNSLIKEIDMDYDQSTTLSEYYNGVEEVVEMHSFDNEELNSLIECGSLGTNVAETRQNTVTSDQGESSVSGCDSTIGAFDTFAQITKVTPKTAFSKDIKYVNTAKQGKNDSDINESFVYAEKNGDLSSKASVTGIPILQGVISDVMSKINSASVTKLDKSVDSNEISEIVEISSDEEEVIGHESNDLKIVNKNIIQECDREINIKESDEDKLQTTKNLKTSIKDPNYKTDIFSSINVTNNISDKIINSDKTNVKKNNTYNIVMKCATIETENMQFKKGIERSEENYKRVEVMKRSSNEIINKRKDVVEFRKETDIKLQNDKNKLKLKELINNTKETEETDIEERDQIAIKMKNIEVLIDEKIKTYAIDAASIQKPKCEDEKLKTSERIQLQNTDIKKTNIEEIIEIEDVIENKAIKNKINEEKQCKKSKELEVTKINEYENKKVTHSDTQRLAAVILSAKETALLLNAKNPEIHLERVAEAEITKKTGIIKSKVPIDIQGKIEAKKLKDIELVSVLDTDVQRVNEESIKETYETKLIKEDETKKAKEAEEKKNSVIEMNKKITEIKETEIVDLTEPDIKDVEHEKNDSLLQKYSDIEIGFKNKETESIIQDQGVSTSEESNIAKKLEQPLVDSKQVNVNENTKELESKICNVKEQEQLNIAENEVKQNRDAQIITKAKGLIKIDENLKESIRASIVLLEPYMTPMTNGLKFNHGNTCNLKVVNSNACVKDLSINSSESANEVSSKLRTRSSLFKQSNVLETKSLSSPKSVDQIDTCTISKASLETKTKIPASSDHESPTTSCSSQHKISLSQTDTLSKALSENSAKKLIASVEMLSSPKENGDQCTDNVQMKQLEINNAINEHLPQTITENSDNLNTKKRGRKRRLDTKNDELDVFHSENLTPHLDASDVTINTSFTNTVEEPPTKRAKKKVKSPDNSISPETRKHELEMIYGNIIENHKIFLYIDKQIHETSMENLAMIKDMSYPVLLDDIKNKINSEEIKGVADLKLHFLRMSMNFNMLNGPDHKNTFKNDLADKQIFLSSIDQNNKISHVDDNDSDDKELELRNNKYNDYNDDADSSDCSYDDDFDYDSLLLNETRDEIDSDSSSSDE